MCRQHIESNLPFALESFNEATEKQLSHAKAEAEAFLSHMVQRAGLKQLRIQHTPAPIELQEPANDRE